MTKSLRARVLGAMGALSALTMLGALGACSSSGGGGSGSETCNVAYDCPAGQTCWSTDGTTFACMASGGGALGDPCDVSLAGIAKPSCGDGMLCLGLGEPAVGRCAAWCDAADGCPSGETCAAGKTTLGASLHVCFACNLAYDCPAGQTCATSTGETFACAPSGSGVEGSTCDATVGASVQCGDGLVCLATGDPTAGTCVPWCSGAITCADGKSCQQVTTTKGATLLVCA